MWNIPIIPAAKLHIWIAKQDISMNILLVSSKYMPEYSGSGLRAHNLYKRLLRKSRDLNLCGILAGSETENDSRTYDYDDFSVKRIACKPYTKLSHNPVYRRLQIFRNFRSEFLAAREFMERMKVKPDIVHIFGKNYVTTAAVVFCVSNSIPILIELCNEMDTPDFHIPFPSRLFINSTPTEKFKYVCISERLKNVCLNNGIPERRIWCRPNPVDEKKFFPVNTKEKFEIRQQITGLGAEVKLLSYIAKIIPRKNHLFLLDVIENMPKNYKLFMGGPAVAKGLEFERDAALIRKIENEIQDRNLSQRVIFKTGFFKNIDEIYKMSDVYLFPTKEEGLGTPLLESIACGTPVVANKIEGITDVWIKNGENGFISELNSESFTEKIMQASSIPQDIMRSQSESIKSVSGTDTIDTRYLDLFFQIQENN